MQKLKSYGLSNTVIFFLLSPLVVVVFFTLVLLFGAAVSMALAGGVEPQATIHKTLNLGDYHILVVTKMDYLTPIPGGRIYLEIWSHGKKVTKYLICHTDEIAEYSERIDSVTLLPDSREIEIEFPPPHGGKRRYKIPETGG